MPRSREANAAYRRERYAAYAKFCEEIGEPMQWRRWSPHFTELQARYGETTRRLSREELRQWWLDRFPINEIFEMAGALDFLRVEDEGGERFDQAA